MGMMILAGIAIIAIVSISVVLIFIKRYRKAGLSVLTITLSAILLAAFYLFLPRHYERTYENKSSEWKDLSFRKYADSIHFHLGAIPGDMGVSDPLFCNNFNSVTPENALKMGPLLRNFPAGEYDFSNADSIVNQAIRQNIRVRGHTLVWGKQSDMFKSPDLGKWLENYPEDARSRILGEATENHIRTVLNHFRGRINTWDVVNEPMSMIRQGKLENNVYLKYLGENYIPVSFELAHSIDPQLRLFLNENLVSYKDRTSAAFLELIRKMQKNKIHIDGIGLQSHIITKRDTSVADLQNYIKEITDLGLEVEITELDARLKIFKDAEDPYQAQADYYARILKACLGNPLCTGVTFWGISDQWSWEDHSFFPKPNEPYLFDHRMNPKPAFLGIYSVLKSEYESRQKSNPDIRE